MPKVNFSEIEDLHELGEHVVDDVGRNGHIETIVNGEVTRHNPDDTSDNFPYGIWYFVRWENDQVTCNDARRIELWQSEKS